MKDKGVTQAELAKGIGVSQSRISDCIRGQRDFTLSQFVDIANFFETSTDKLLGFTPVTAKADEATLADVLQKLFDINQLININMERINITDQNALPFDTVPETYLALYFKNDALEKNLEEWAAVDSITTQDAEMKKKLLRLWKEEALSMAASMGFVTKNYENYVGAVDFNEKEKALDILAHLDVVPVSDEWTVTKPFEPIIKDGKLYGRGASDDKGPAVTALYAMKAVKDLNIPLNKNVRLILGTDEECGSSDIKYYYDREEEAPMTFSPDADFPLINVEKGSFKPEFRAEFVEDKKLPRIVSVNSGVKVNVIPDRASAVIEGISYNELLGYCERKFLPLGITYKITEEDNKCVINIRGTGAHAAYPESGNNALTAMLELLCEMPFAESEGFKRLCAVNKLFPHGDYKGKAIGVNISDEVSGELTLSFTIFEYNMTSLKGTFDCRAPLCATNENLRDVVAKNLKDNGIILEPCEVLPGHHVDENSEFVQTLLSCYEKYSGQKGECLAIGGGTYVHNLKNGVAFGCTMPGTDNNMHGDDEFAVVDELILSAKIFTEAIIQLCS